MEKLKWQYVNSKMMLAGDPATGSKDWISDVDLEAGQQYFAEALYRQPPSQSVLRHMMLICLSNKVRRRYYRFLRAWLCSQILMERQRA